jgi:hypothetical protein
MNYPVLFWLTGIPFYESVIMPAKYLSADGYSSDVNGTSLFSVDHWFNHTDI